MRGAWARDTIPPALRARGRLAARFELGSDGRTHIASLEEAGGYRLRFPRVRTSGPKNGMTAADPACEGAIINTGGGVAGGDSLTIDVELAALSHVVISSPSAERVYGSAGPNSEIAIRMRLGEGARLAFMPRETILFSGARLKRRLDVEMDASASLIVAEAIVFGRLAMGETMLEGLLDDRWRIKRDGGLLHAEQARLEGAIGELLENKAIGSGMRAAATVILVSRDAEDRLEAARASLKGARSDCAASAWNGMLIGRFMATDAAPLRRDLVRFLLSLTRHTLPHAWTDDHADSSRASADDIERAAHSVPDWPEPPTKEAEVAPDPA